MILRNATRFMNIPQIFASKAQKCSIIGVLLIKSLKTKNTNLTPILTPIASAKVKQIHYSSTKLCHNMVVDN